MKEFLLFFVELESDPECISADMYTERKPDIFVHYCMERRVDDLCVNFLVHMVQYWGHRKMKQ